MLIVTPEWKKIKQLRKAANDGLLTEYEFKLLLGLLQPPAPHDDCEELPEEMLMKVPLDKIEAVEKVLKIIDDPPKIIEGFGTDDEKTITLIPEE